ncbi:putative glucan 1, 4-alpha-glucosidase [Triangularia setosa]|uniref:Glucan 1, 4-alpha-glucosidase n=1 Tax=Triangularia setosa TaxID=2587417 RepID=A0AAN6W3J8_9PEZI|nr:putative glucan 1, 4-alpha-glucosidase [Podospora setosa]
MDDPWRSPWTANDVDADKDHKLSSPSKSDLAPPPRALLSGSSSPRISAVVESSPWGDDGDGFGDWAGSSTPAADASSVHSGWGGAWGATSPNLAPIRRDDDFGKPSPIAWPGNIATPKPANGSAFRQPSPDPWATESSFEKTPNDIDAPQVVVDLASPVRATHFETLNDIGLGLTGLDAEWDNASVEENREGPPEIAHSSGHEEKQGEDPEQLPKQNGESRSYTPSNEETDHDDHQDSPITSVDEDHRGRQREPAKPAGKVQELVVKFDGLAKAKSQESLRVPRPKSSGSVDKRDISSENGDFGEFEDTEKVESCPPVDRVEQPGALQSPEDMERPVTPPSSQDVKSPLTPQSSKSKCEHGTPRKLSPPERASAAASPTVPPTTKTDRPAFKVNLDRVGELFGSMKVPATLPIINIDGEIPERVITDSFSEISERKTWYRLSRFGSARRHNAADEDSYRRVAWSTSTVRQEVITIVRRWMEEDSIAGRVALGGGISKTQKNMFGWDSSAKPVGLDAVFGKRKAESRAIPPQPVPVSDPPASVFQGLHPTASRLGYSLEYPPPAMQSQPVASFGWSESPAFTPTSISALAPPPRPSTGESAPPASHGAAGDDGEDDDEDWGEMVSSPVESKPSGLRNFDDAFAVPVAPAPTNTLPEPEPAAETILATSYPWSSTDLPMLDAPAAASSQSKAPAALPTPSDTPTTLAFSPIVVSFPLSLSETPTPSPTFRPPIQTSPPRPKPLPSTRPFTPSVPSRLSEHMSLPTEAIDPINDQTTNDDEVVQRIILNLPDLSYMLR